MTIGEWIARRRARDAAAGTRFHYFKAYKPRRVLSSTVGEDQNGLGFLPPALWLLPRRYHGEQPQGGRQQEQQDEQQAREQEELELARQRARQRRCWNAGRLDLDSEGLLLFTNDGVLSHILTAPWAGVLKSYRVCVEDVRWPHQRRAFDDSCWELLVREGVDIGDGKHKCKLDARSRVLDTGADGRTLLLMCLREGRKRELRRMLRVLSFRVLSLCRLSVGEGPYAISLLGRGGGGGGSDLEPVEGGGAREKAGAAVAAELARLGGAKLKHAERELLHRREAAAAPLRARGGDGGEGNEQDEAASQADGKVDAIVVLEGGHDSALRPGQVARLTQAEVEMVYAAAEQAGGAVAAGAAGLRNARH